MIRDFLPIGSVVMLKNANKAIMIFGIKQMDSNDTSVEYDYIGVLYPEGNIGSDFQYLFNHEDIQEVLFTGYETDEQKDFLDTVAKAYGE